MTTPLRLHVERQGTAAPPVVLAHGFAGSARNFRVQARALSSEASVVTYDARGHARSEAPAEAEAASETTEPAAPEAEAVSETGAAETGAPAAPKAPRKSRAKAAPAPAETPAT
jgi:pimeloyl-ACP methyl ester carboxylesterase